MNTLTDDLYRYFVQAMGEKRSVQVIRKELKEQFGITSEDSPVLKQEENRIRQVDNLQKIQQDRKEKSWIGGNT